MTIDAAAATGSLRTLGTGATQAAVGDHTHTLGVDVQVHSATRWDGSSSQTVVNNNNVTDGDDLNTDTSTYAENTKVVIFGGAMASGNHGPTIKVAVRLVFDGTTIGTTAKYGSNTWSMKTLQGTVSIGGGAGGSKVAVIEWNVDSGTPGMLYASSHLQVASIEIT